MENKKTFLQNKESKTLKKKKKKKVNNYNIKKDLLIIKPHILHFVKVFDHILFKQY